MYLTSGPFVTGVTSGVNLFSIKKIAIKTTETILNGQKSSKKVKNQIEVEN